MLSKIYAVSVNGLEAQEIEIEVDVARGLPAFTIVGLADTAIQESRERIRSAIKNSNFEFPKTKITVNLAPADIKKKGPSFDLPIAIGLLAQSQIFKSEILEHALFIGELALDGGVRPVKSVLPSAIFCKQQGYKYIFVPEANAQEAALIPGVQVISVKNLAQCTAILTGEDDIKVQEETDISSIEKSQEFDVDFSHIVGQEQAKRALIIAAAGGHNILMEWPPGSGKTMLAKAFASILPRLSFEELVEVSKIYSIAGLLTKEQPIITHRPFRKIHHTASSVSVIGGGRDSRPGEISLAHRGVLFLDEFLEFPLHVIETLRQPLEDRQITINRAQATYTYPADFILVGAFNPTPSGYEMDDPKMTDSQYSIDKYRAKLSGPIVDRMDLFVSVPRVPVEDIRKNTSYSQTSADIQKVVQKVREIQMQRFEREDVLTNASMTNQLIKKYCQLDEQSEKFLQDAVQRLELSTRAYFRILKLARTIADIEEENSIGFAHVAEALSYRKN